MVQNFGDNKKLRTTFLLVKNKHVIGMLDVEPIQKANQLIISTHELCCSSVPATMGVYLLWVHKRFRGQNVASDLLDAAREKFSYAIPCLPVKEIAFSSPTEAGIAFASKYIRRVHGTEGIRHILVYECPTS